MANFSHDEILTFIAFVKEKDMYRFIDGKTAKNEHVYAELGRLVTESKLLNSSFLILFIESDCGIDR